MCRKHRRCRTNKAAAAARARNYRARRREAATAAVAEPTTAPATNDQDTAVSPDQSTGGDVTPNQPTENLPRKSAFARRIEKFAKQERAAQARKQVANALLAEAETAAATTRQHNQERDQKAWEQRQAQSARSKPTRAQGDVTRSKRRREVEDHTDGRASKQDRVWTVSPTPVPTAKPNARGRDATQDTRRDSGRDGGVGPVSGEGNLTLVSPRGPLHISMSGRDGSPEVAGDVTPASDGEPTTSATRRKPAQAGQPRQRTARQGDVTDRQSTGRDRTRDRAAHGRDTGDTGTVDVVGDGHITVTGARPGQVTRVTNHAAPGSRVGHQNSGHVHGVNVTVTGAATTRGTTDGASGEDGPRARDIARTVADRVHRAISDVAEALGDVTHNEPGHHTNSTSGTQAIQAPHIHNSRVVRDHD